MARTKTKKHSFSLVLASDHAGVRFKQNVYAFLARKKFVVLDMGTFDETTVDYPDFIIPTCEVVAQSNGKIRGIVFGKSGIGESIAANKVAGIRASVCFDAQTAKLTRQHNDSNVLCLGQDTAAGKSGVWQKILGAWLATDFSGDARHVRRLKKIALYEQKKEPTDVPLR